MPFAKWDFKQMLYSIVLSTQPASFSALTYKGGLQENIRKIKELGFDGVELAVRQPDLLNMAELIKMLTESGLTVPAIGTGQAFAEEGLSLTAEDDLIREKAVERIQSHIRLAKVLQTQVIIGLIRGHSTGRERANRVHDRLVGALQRCADADDSVRLVIEPINRYETNLINTVASALQLLEKIGRSNVGLLLDTFHMNIEEPSILESISAAGTNLFHFHVADSNRWYPGAGHIDFRQILYRLSDLSYNGFVSAEILPNPDPDTAARRTIEYLRSIFP
jgi:sugar phosphate isomerase/epimerase